MVAAPASAATTWTVTSPDGETEADVTLSDRDLSIAIHSDGTTLVQSSSLGITTASADFTTGLSFEGRTDTTDSGRYGTTSGSRLSHSYAASLMTLRFTNANGGAVELDVRAADDGVAYRYRVPRSGTVEERSRR